MTSDKRQFYNLEQWLKLSDIERYDIINHIWNPYTPIIAFKTKSEIVEHFIENTKIDANQYGIKSFGWTVYMIYVIVDNSKKRVPTKFLGLSVNKGVIINYTQDKKAIVKFGYGGSEEMDLSKKTNIW
jgi:hypothetical protein